MLRDARGYARIFTNAAGTVTQYDDYDAFGNQTTSNGTIPTTHYFPDGTLDIPSGLVFHMARQESTFNGNFIERDFGPDGQGQDGLPISLNKYIYADADPVNGDDPSGHGEGLGELLVVTGAIALLETMACLRFTVHSGRQVKLPILVPKGVISKRINLFNKR